MASWFSGRTQVWSDRPGAWKVRIEMPQRTQLNNLTTNPFRTKVGKRLAGLIRGLKRPQLIGAIFAVLLGCFTFHPSTARGQDAPSIVGSSPLYSFSGATGYRCLCAGNSGERSVDDQFHQFGVAKVTGAKPGSSKESASTGAVGNSRRKPSARVTPNDAQVAERREYSASGIRVICKGMFGGPDRDRTDDLFHAMEARSQLRHRPTLWEGLVYCRGCRGSSQTIAESPGTIGPGPVSKSSRVSEHSAAGGAVLLFASTRRLRAILQA